MYGINSQRHTIIMPNEKQMSNELYGGGRNAIKEYLLLFIIDLKYK